DEVFASQGTLCLFFVLRSPRSETVTEPRHSWRESGKSEFLPNLFSVLHKIFSGQGNRSIGPGPGGIGQKRRTGRQTTDMGRHSRRIAGWTAAGRDPPPRA